MINEELVVTAYRLILGRDPESPEAVQYAVEHYADLQALRAALLGSDEFRTVIGAALPSQPQRGLKGFAARARDVLTRRAAQPQLEPDRFPLDRDTSQVVELSAAPESVGQLFRRVEETWRNLGQTEPYWSVLTNEAFRTDKFSANQEAFWKSGESDVERFLIWAHRNGITPDPSWTCLEYGCGTGRITRALVRQFREVVACDVSAPHLALAQKAVAGHGTGAARFLHIESMDTLRDLPAADVVFSIIVLQHNPPPVIAAILEALFDRLRPGGVAYFQVPTRARNYRFTVSEYLRTSSSGNMEMHVIPQSGVFEIARSHRCEVLELQPDNMTGSADYVSNTFLFRKAQA